jgi:hypothetical protein
MRALHRLLAPALAVLPAVALAQTRPLLTEQATTAPAGTVVFETGADFMSDEPNPLTGEERDRFDGPLLRLVWSPADRVELDLEWVARVAARDDPTFGSVSDWGDVTLRAKARFREATRGPALGARFGVTLPQTSFGNGLGPNTLRSSVQFLLSQPIGAAWLHANVGLAIEDEPLHAHAQSDFLHYGLALEAPLGGSVTALAEVAGLAGAGSPGADARHEARAGLRVGRGRVRGDAAARIGLGDADGSWGVTAGIAWDVRSGR